MENKDIILNELKDISTVVAGIGNHTPYTAPQDYFKNLPVEIMLRIAMEEKSGVDPVLNINKANTYTIPGGYFDGLAGNILSRIKQQEEIDSQKEDPSFSSPLWQQIGKKNPFSLPDGYFSEFSENVVAGVKAIQFVNDELENLSPLMNSLRNKPVYEVPEGYFASTPAAILNKARHQPGKVVSFGFGKKIIRYAAAAAVTGIVAFSVYFYSGSKSGVQPVIEPSQIAKVDGQEIKVSDQEIETFLNNNTVALADIGADTLNTLIPVNTSAATDDTKDLLANISDEELQQYLEQHGGTPNSFTN